MYITLKSLPVQHTLFNSAPQVKPTLVLPQNKNVEIRASNNELSLYPGQLQNNWFVQESSRVSVHLAKESDVSLTAVTNQKETHGSTPWEQVEDLTKNENTSSEEHPELNNQEHWYKNSIKTGNGTYKLNIEKAYNLNMSVLENKKPAIAEGFSHIIALIPSNTNPIINPQTAPFTRIHCKSLPTLFSIISINVLSSNLSRFSCTSLPIFEWFFSTSVTTCFCNHSSIF